MDETHLICQGHQHRTSCRRQLVASWASVIALVIGVEPTVKLGGATIEFAGVDAFWANL